MRQSIKVAALALVFLLVGYVTYSQTIEPGLGNVATNCTLTTAYTANTIQPVVINATGNFCVNK